MLLTTMLITASLIVSNPAVHHKYMKITEIKPFNVETDLVTVCDAEGNEYDFYADKCTYMVPDYVKVTITTEGEVIDAE